MTSVFSMYLRGFLDDFSLKYEFPIKLFFQSKLRILNVLISGKNEQFNPQKNNIPSFMTFVQSFLKQISSKYTHLYALKLC